MLISISFSVALLFGVTEAVVLAGTLALLLPGFETLQYWAAGVCGFCRWRT